MKSPKTYYFFLILVLVAFFQSTIWPANLVFLLLVIWAYLRSPQEVLVTALFSGLVLDFLIGSHLGTKSLVFLAILAVILFLRSRFFPKVLNAWKALPFVMLSVFLGSIILSIATNWLDSGKFSLFFLFPAAFWEVILAVFAYPIFEYLSLRWEKGEDSQLQLKV